VIDRTGKISGRKAISTARSEKRGGHEYTQNPLKDAQEEERGGLEAQKRGGIVLVLSGKRDRFLFPKPEGGAASVRGAQTVRRARKESCLIFGEREKRFQLRDGGGNGLGVFSTSGKEGKNSYYIVYFCLAKVEEDTRSIDILCDEQKRKRQVFQSVRGKKAVSGGVPIHVGREKERRGGADVLKQSAEKNEKGLWGNDQIRLPYLSHRGGGIVFGFGREEGRSRKKRKSAKQDSCCPGWKREKGELILHLIGD